MQISIKNNKLKALKKVLGKTQIKKDIERLINDWADREILNYKKNRLDINQVIDELNK